jgi:hypothetical protein
MKLRDYVPHMDQIRSLLLALPEWVILLQVADLRYRAIAHSVKY